ncbi:MAG: 2-phospho-L-lactate guanylyltransferase [Anaerolineales bacterium]|jgi:2-phospho-L-lactate guanylyltransferase
MALWAIVPVKPLRKAKSRLAGVLTKDERADLGERLLVHTLSTLQQVPGIACTLVVSRDSRVLSLAREMGARTVTERGSPHLNRALVRATVVAKGYGVSAVLVLPADLPLIASKDIEKLMAKATLPPVVVIAPDHKGKGTNALLSSPPGLIEYDFGDNSFARHVAAAKQAGARVEVCKLPGLGLDLDDPIDLKKLRRKRPEALKVVRTKS